MTGPKRTYKNQTDKSTNSTDSAGGNSAGYPVVLLVVVVHYAVALKSSEVHTEKMQFYI